MKIGIILGTRPEIIKLSSIINSCEKKGLDYFILHTGQHYAYNLDKIFFKELGLNPRIINLDIGSGTHGEITGKQLIGIEKVLMNEKPDIILVEGDTNTVLSGSLAAVKLHIKVGHVEAGLRSYFRDMPEEHNRIVADHLSDLLFTPTIKAKNILINEGIPKNRIFITGNTIVDAVNSNLKIAKERSNILKELDIKKNNFFLITAHREENVDNKERLENMLKGFRKLSEKYNLPLIYPIHPRTKKNIKKFNLGKKLKENKNLKIIEPVGFFDFLTLESNAELVLTDSGGVQEETCILGIPCVTLRDNTERPETLEVESNILSGCNPDKIVDSVELMLNKKKNWKNPFGDGTAGEKIIKIIQQRIK